jgi:phenylalanyl-tRNA synthetase beta subunit
MVGEQSVGTILQLHPRTTDVGKLGEKSAVVYVELDIAAIIGCVDSNRHKLPQTNHDHILTRDVCFVLPKESSREKLLQAIRTIEPIHHIAIQDIYEG